MKAEHVANQLSGIPIGPFDQDNKKRGVIFILEKASLEVAKVCKAMLMILDSTLNKAGKLRVLYVRTEKGVLLKLNHMFVYQGHISGSLVSYYSCYRSLAYPLWASLKSFYV